jgi:hypothetical protein
MVPRVARSLRKWVMYFFLAFFWTGVVCGQTTKPLGMYLVPEDSAFRYAADRSFGDYYVFEWPDANQHLYVSKAPVSYERKAYFNARLSTHMVDAYNMGYYLEKGRSSSFSFSFLGQKKAYFMRFGRPKSSKSKSKIYNLYTRLGDQVYTVWVMAETGQKKPPKQATAFLKGIKLQGAAEQKSGSQKNPAP